MDSIFVIENVKTKANRLEGPLPPSIQAGQTITVQKHFGPYRIYATGADIVRINPYYKFTTGTRIALTANSLI